MKNGEDKTSSGLLKIVGLKALFNKKKGLSPILIEAFPNKKKTNKNYQLIHQI
jgi:hypothetical protein